MRKLLFSILLLIFTFSLYAEIEIDGKKYKVIDTHLHTGDFGAMPVSSKQFMVDFIMTGKLYVPAVVKHVTNPWAEYFGIKAHLDMAGVDRAILLSAYTQHTSGYNTNHYVLDLLDTNKNKGADSHPIFFGLAGMNFDDWDDPTIVESRIEAIESCLLNRNDRFKGIKLAHAHQGVAFNDPLYYEIYAAAARTSVPVLLHSGFSPFPGSKDTPEYYDPAYLEEAAGLYDGIDSDGEPNDESVVNFVLAHGGSGDKRSVRNTIDMMVKHPNIFLELSAMGGTFEFDDDGNKLSEEEQENDPDYDEETGQLTFILKLAKEHNLSKRIIFATDGPQYPGMIKIYLNKVILALKKNNYTETEIADILYNNAKDLFKLP